MKFIKFLTEKRVGLISSILIFGTALTVAYTLHQDKEVGFALMIWAGLGAAAIAYTYYEFKNLDKNDWI